MSLAAWLAGNLDLVRHQLWEHVQLTGAAVLLALCVTAPLVWLTRRLPPVRGPLLALTGALYTVPSLALFVLLVGVTGLSRATALIGLVAYSLLILLRNTLVAFDTVPADVREAALAAGHTRRQLAWRVELPLALPVILAGVRLATVSAIGLVTITALIGYGGLGRLFLLGFQRRHSPPLIVGLALSVLLAFAAEWALGRLERRLTPWRRREIGAGTDVRPWARSRSW